jgi:hypothetical protein
VSERVAGAPAPRESGPRASAARERGWGAFVAALAAALLVAVSAAWPPAAQPLAALVRVLVPVQETLLLAVPAVAACTVVGWWAGGRLALAVAWTVLAALVLVLPLPARAEAYATLARGWALLLAGAFGVACVLGGPARPFVGRGLAAVGLAFALGAGAVVLAEGRAAQVGDVTRAEYTRRVERSLDRWRRHAAGPAWRAGDGARAVRTASAAVEGLALLPAPAARLAPALLGLESLAALALAWAVYHRLARTRLGPPLARLADFRFNDQLVWGVVVGATLVALPSLAELRPVGINLLVFFGALYALRGLGVLRWWADGWLAGLGAAGALLVAALLVPLVGVALPAALLAAAALALGLGDTVAGWRARPRASAAGRP